MEPIPRAVDATRSTGTVSAQAQVEARRLGHHYLGPEHLLLGMLVHGDNLAARVLVAHGLDLETVRAEVDRLITAGHAAETDRMRAWLARWRRPAADAGSDHDPSLLPGMLAERQLAWLQTLHGTQFDRGFLTMMGTHHGGAVELAEAELRAGTSAEVKAFARQVLEARQREIRQLQQWRDTWTLASQPLQTAATGGAQSCCLAAGAQHAVPAGWSMVAARGAGRHGPKALADATTAPGPDRPA